MEGAKKVVGQLLINLNDDGSIEIIESGDLHELWLALKQIAHAEPPASDLITQ